MKTSGRDVSVVITNETLALRTLEMRASNLLQLVQTNFFCAPFPTADQKYKAQQHSAIYTNLLPIHTAVTTVRAV
jgi:hypothetical protein